jgi:hypothetical protein
MLDHLWSHDCLDNVELDRCVHRGSSARSHQWIVIVFVDSGHGEDMKDINKAEDVEEEGDAREDEDERLGGGTTGDSDGGEF